MTGLRSRRGGCPPVPDGTVRRRDKPCGGSQVSLGECDGKAVQEWLHGCFAEAPPSLMRSVLVVVLPPFVEVRLQLC